MSYVESEDSDYNRRNHRSSSSSRSRERSSSRRSPNNSSPQYNPHPLDPRHHRGGRDRGHSSHRPSSSSHRNDNGYLSSSQFDPRQNGPPFQGHSRSTHPSSTPRPHSSSTPNPSPDPTTRRDHEDRRKNGHGHSAPGHSRSNNSSLTSAPPSTSTSPDSGRSHGNDRRSEVNETKDSFSPQVNGSDKEKLDVKSFTDSKDARFNLERDFADDTECARNRDALQNIFGCPADSKDDRKTLPKVASRSTAGELGAPPPKMPKVAHYNRLTSSEDVKYMKDLKPRKADQVIGRIPKGGKKFASGSATDSDSDSEAPKKKHVGVTAKEDVFQKYDFKRRLLNVEGLPIYKEKKKLIEEIERNRILIIEGSTGCGKTTQVPQFIIDSHFEKNRRCNIIVTQPRKFAASSLARRVCAERGWELGTVVDFQYKGSKNKNHPDTLLKYVTTGTLLQQLIRTKSLSRWSHIIIDEVHERDLETDLLLLLIKKILQDDVSDKAKTVRIILMSATMNTTKFSKYFLVQKSNMEISEAPVIKMRTINNFNIEEFYLEDIVKDKDKVEQVYNRIIDNLKDSSAKIVDELNSYAVSAICGLDALEKEERQRNQNSGSQLGENEAGSVLVFLPGIAEMKELERRLNKEKAKFEREGDETTSRLKVLLFHSNCTKEDQEKVFARPKPNQRKVILATNIAESSITIPDIVYVIDFCLTKSNCIDKRTNFNSLRTCWCSVNQCNQRRGRTGRVRDGRVYRMLPKKFFLELEKETVPDMLKSSLEYVVLKIKMLDSGSPKELLAMALDPPLQSGIERAIVTLKEVGGLKLMTTRKKDFVPTSTSVLDQREPEVERFYDSCDGDLTFLGRVMATLPLTVQCCRLIMLGFCFGVFEETLIIAASLSFTRSAFLNEKDNELECYLSKRRWTKGFQSDCMSLLRIYHAWQAEKLKQLHRNHEINWARTHHIHLGQMRDIEEMVDEITKRVEEGSEIPSVKAYMASSRSQSNSSAGNSQELVKAKEFTHETVLFIKLAIAGAFYPNYFVPGYRSSELELSKIVDGMDLLSTVYYSNFPRRSIGELYAKTVSDSLAYIESIPRVKFSGQNILVSFGNSNRKLDPISEDLYRAIKKRQIRKYFEFKLLEPREERAVHEKLRRRQRRLQDNIFVCPPQVQLPNIETKYINVVVGHVESPSRFWVILLDQLQSRSSISKVINENLLNLPMSCNSPQLAIHALVLAKADESFDIKRRYFRGRVDFIDWTREEALVFFIDTGHSARLPVNHLQSISPAHENIIIDGSYTVKTYPALAIECTLSETKPSLMYGSMWAEQADVIFRELLDTRKSKFLQIKIYAVHQSIIYGEFIAHPRRRDSETNLQPFNFNKEMKKLRYADHVEESFLVKRNNDARDKIRNRLMMDPAQIEGCNREQVAEALDLDFLEPPRGGRTICKLEGPFSPLELKFQSLCHATRTADVEVDRQSVNSVCFDHRPTAPISRLLVASSINIQENSKRLMARETTMMPPIPGLLGLVSLMFAPKVELRTDSQQQKYNGALCGLGSYSTGNLEDEEPIYLDHDQEVVFDAPLDDEDIQKVNQIRYSMSMMLRKNEGTITDGFREHLRNTIKELLKKPREPLEAKKRGHPLHPYQWNRIDEADLKPPSKKAFPTKLLHDDVFELHSSVIFREVVDNYGNDWGSFAS